MEERYSHGRETTAFAVAVQAESVWHPKRAGRTFAERMDYPKRGDVVYDPRASREGRRVRGVVAAGRALRS